LPQVDLGDLEPVDYNPFANPSGPLANYAPPAPPQDMTAAARAGQLGTLSAGDQSWGQNLAGGFSNAMGYLGATPTGQKNAYEFGQNLESVIPGVNNAVSANQAYRDFGQGNYVGGALNTIGAIIPPVPGASTGERTLASVLAKEAEPIGGRVMMEGGTPGLLAYHGSRHDFPSFDISKIGEGEGAQVYGHGLYFAEHPEVAEGYRTAGMDSDQQLLDPKGNVVNRADLGDPNRPYTEAQTAYHHVLDWGGLDEASEYLNNVINNSKLEPDSTSLTTMRSMVNQINDWKKQGYSLSEPREGYKYQVGINHDPDTFFDLDAKFGDQHPDVQAAANQIFGRKFQKDMSGSDVYDYLTEKLDDGKYLGNDPHVDLANEFNKQGVPGIRYFDEGSRNPNGLPFDPYATLGSLPQKVQNKITSIVPGTDPGDAMEDVHSLLHNHILDNEYAGVSPKGNEINEDAANRLIKAGVPKWTAPQTRNYVTFSDKNINILKKWGAGGALLAGSTGAASAQDFYKQHPDLDRHSLTDTDDGGQ
jgi:hypothetical protein